MFIFIEMMYEKIPVCRDFKHTQSKEEKTERKKEKAKSNKIPVTLGKNELLRIFMSTRPVILVNIWINLPLIVTETKIAFLKYIILYVSQKKVLKCCMMGNMKNIDIGQAPKIRKNVCYNCKINIVDILKSLQYLEIHSSSTT